MKKGTILGRIAKDISLSNYACQEPLGKRTEWAIRNAIPSDIWEWFVMEMMTPPLTKNQGLRLVQWLFIEPKKAKLDLKKIRLLRQARKEQIISTIQDNLPTPAIMANATKAMLQAYKFKQQVADRLIPFLAETMKRDEQSIMVSIGWAIKAGHLFEDDLVWLADYTRPIAEYEQVLLIKSGEESSPASGGEEPSEYSE